MVFTDVERDNFEEVIRGERFLTDVLSRWWMRAREEIEDSIDDKENYVILTTENC